MKSISELFSIQHCYFETGETLNYHWRIMQLKQLKLMIKEYTDQLINALKKDLGKPEHEAFNSELALLLAEIDYSVKNLNSWMKNKLVHVPIINTPSKGSYYLSPFGTVLIIGTWNYPVLLLLQPLISALAAGNCVVLKPSEYAVSTNEVIVRAIGKYFDPKVVSCISGGAQQTMTAIENGNPDMVFFTGGTDIGRNIMRLCSDQLIPVVLELGGCCPCIVDSETNLKIAARRIAFGKFFNAGQTCVAPNTCYVSSKIRDEFISEMSRTLKEFYGNDPVESPYFARIISEKHFSRLETLLHRMGGMVIAGGNFRKDILYISPTLVLIDYLKSSIISEEIFGPILPVTFYDDLDELLIKLRRMSSPLVVYLFSSNKSIVAKVRKRTVSGSFCVNSTLHIMMCGELPFGGVGKSGMGRYHGKSGFESFSYKRAEFYKSMFPDLKFLYPPYNVPLNMIKKTISYFLR